MLKIFGILKLPTLHPFNPSFKATNSLKKKALYLISVAVYTSLCPSKGSSGPNLEGPFSVSQSLNEAYKTSKNAKLFSPPNLYLSPSS
jgi:hypothetical protein